MKMGKLTFTIVLDDHELRDAVRSLRDAFRRRNIQLDRIEQKLDRFAHQEEIRMGQLDDDLTTVEGSLDVLDADEQRELADLQAIKDNPTAEMTPEQQARFDVLVSRIHGEVAAIDAVDPAPATPIGDGSDAGATPIGDTGEVTGDGSGEALPPVDGTPVAAE